jgi:hypothetical protein
MKKTEVIDSTNYPYEHNKAVNRYKRTALFLLWAGLINIIATIIEQFRFPPSYAFMFSSNGILSYSFGLWLSNPILLAIITSLIAFIIGGIFVFLGYYASLGHKWALLTGSAIYLLDFISLLIFFPGSSYFDFILAVAVHVSFSVTFFIAIITYEEVIALEKKYAQFKENTI